MSQVPEEIRDHVTNPINLYSATGVAPLCLRRSGTYIYRLLPVTHQHTSTLTVAHSRFSLIAAGMSEILQ
jgi:hypothetical protein